jgi:hypothetical protein
MKRLVALVLSMAAMMSMIAGTAALAQDDNKPSIYVPEIRHDFGRVFEQEKYEYDFVVKNRGKADLIIEKVKPG